MRSISKKSERVYNNSEVSLLITQKNVLQIEYFTYPINSEM